MSRDNPPRFITRKEFYAAQSVVWIYLSIILGRLARTTDNWFDYVLWAAAIVMILGYAFLSWRNK